MNANMGTIEVTTTVKVEPMTMGKAQRDRNAALDDMREATAGAVREFERRTGETVTRVDLWRKGPDWAIEIRCVHCVGGLEEKIFA